MSEPDDGLVAVPTLYGDDVLDVMMLRAAIRALYNDRRGTLDDIREHARVSVPPSRGRQW